jgi:hypothetical protein
MKLSFFEKEKGRDCSFFKVSAAELPKLCGIVVTLLKEIKESKGKLPLRLALSPYKDVEDRTNIDFFDPCHTEFLNSKRLGIRQHLNYEGVWTLRFFAPCRENRFQGWIGPTCTMSIGQAGEFLQILKEMEAYIHQRQEEDS